MRTLYLPIHIPGTYHERSRQNKRGLFDALNRVGACREVDYLSISSADLDGVLRSELDSFQPDLLFTQIQGTDPITADMLARLRADYPDLRVANWNGDVWPEHLVSPDMLAVLHHVDVQLVVNASVLDTYAREGIRAAFCPFGYEDAPNVATETPNCDVLFLGNNYSPQRQRLYEVLRSLPYTVAIYGVGWPQSEGETNYDFAATNALYRKARIVVSDNQFPDAAGYLSDRPIQALSVGALVLQQYVADLEALTGLRDGAHYVQWNSFEELPTLIADWLSVERIKSRARICRDGQAFVQQEHTWDARVRQLMIEWLPELERTRA